MHAQERLRITTIKRRGEKTTYSDRIYHIHNQNLKPVDKPSGCCLFGSRHVGELVKNIAAGYEYKGDLSNRPPRPKFRRNRYHQYLRVGGDTNIW